MRRSMCGLLLAGLLCLAAPGPAAAQKDDSKDVVRFTTVDNVTLTGHYYKGSKGKNSPCVLMLHAMYSDQTKGDWDRLAKELQKKFGYAVLTFDFRGHGKSTDVTPAFWDHQFNKVYIRGNKNGKQTIDVKEFSPGYFPALVNDITAARYFLDQKNDAGECNSSAILVIGAQDACSLGLLWAATEWGRNTAPRQVNPLFPLAPPTQIGPPKLAGADIKAAIWLSFSQPDTKLYKGQLQYATWVPRVPELRDKLPQLFIYGADDKYGEQNAKFMYGKVLRADSTMGKSPKPATTYEKSVAGVKLRGVELLKSPATETLVMKYIEDKTIEKQTAVWVEKDTRSQQLYPPPLDRFGIQAYLKPPGR